MKQKIHSCHIHPAPTRTAFFTVAKTFKQRNDIFLWRLLYILRSERAFLVGMSWKVWKLPCRVLPTMAVSCRQNLMSRKWVLINSCKMRGAPRCKDQGHWAWMLRTAEPVHRWGGHRSPRRPCLQGCKEDQKKKADRCSERELHGKVTAVPRAHPGCRSPREGKTA